ncbi:hypothetical protein ACLB2K_062707 [Fragaria x ananassa]
MPSPVLENETDHRWKWFKNCLGALDGTYVRVRVAATDKPRYRTRKSDIATNVLGVCARDMQFIFVLPGWEGSASDSRVLRDAVTRPNGLRVPTGYYYLVDGGYTNGEGFLAPYRGKRYHLSEWREGCMPINKEEYFNMKHAKARNVIERCFVFEFDHLANVENHDMLESPEASDEWTAWRNDLASQMFGMASGDTNSQQTRSTATRRKWTKFEEDAMLSVLDDFVARGM